MNQLDMFEKIVLQGTAKTKSTSKTYSFFASKVGLSDTEMNRLVDAGAGGKVSHWKRRIRFIQQTLKRKGLIKRGSTLGQWEVTRKGKDELTEAPRMSLRTYFVTNSGLAFWGDANALPLILQGEVSLIICSPPYLLTKDRQYGNIGTSEKEYVDSMMKFADGWMKMLAPDGSIVLNVGPSYKPNSGYQSLHNQRMLIKFEDELGLHLVQEITHWCPNKLPRGHHVTQLKRHLVSSTESFFWLSPNPKKAKADNQAVLSPYSEKFLRMMKSAVARKPAVSYRPSGQSSNDATFYADNGGSIAHDLICSVPESGKSEYSLYCKENNLPRHPAIFPLRIPEFFIKFLTEENDLVVDPFLGSCVTAAAAENNNRRWIGTEKVRQYLDGGVSRFKKSQMVG